MANRKKIIKRKIEYFAIRFLVNLTRLLPRRLGLHLFSGLGSVMYRALRKDREKAEKNLAIAFPEAPSIVRTAISRAMFKSIGRNAFEFIKLANRSQSYVTDLVENVDGWEHLEQAHAKGNGVVAITGHIGCWELLAMYLTRRGYPVTAIARKLWIDRVNQDVMKIRESQGVYSIDRDSSPVQMINILRQGGTLGVLMDQTTSVGGVFVPFFNRPAFTPSGVSRMAAIADAIIVPMAIFMKPNMKHQIKILPPIYPNSVSGDKKEQIESITAACTQSIEELIRMDPKQWVWFHDRWSRKEEGKLDYVMAN